MDAKICDDCKGVLPAEHRPARRTRCPVCRDLLCSVCYHDHKIGNQQTPGKCAWGLEIVTVDQLARMIGRSIQQMSPRDRALLRIKLRKDFKLPTQPEPDQWTQ